MFEHLPREGINRRKTMIPTLVTNTEFDASKILCPVCGGTYSHLMHTETKEGCDKGLAWQGRGDCHVIEFKGECGHNWALCVGFHKGENFLFMTVRKP